MNLIQRATELVQAAGAACLPASDANGLAGEFGVTVEQLLLDLIPLANTFSSPSQSGFMVGATGLGDSGAIYFGSNFEILGCPLNQAVHAEQAVVVNAAAHGETGLLKLAVSAPPCGYCRQFLFELVTADRLQILLAGKPPTKLTEYLPAAFGPTELDVEGGLLSPHRHQLQWVSPSPPSDQAAKAAFQSAAASYAPYTKAPAGAAVSTSDGKVFAGPYLENAAFNPSLSPLQTALVCARLHGTPIEAIAEAAIIQTDDSKIDHVAAARFVLDKISPDITMESYQVHVV